jgi:hypothetical protein
MSRQHGKDDSHPNVNWTDGVTRWLSVSMVDSIPLAGIKLHGNRTGVEATSPAIRTYHPSRQGAGPLRC